MSEGSTKVSGVLKATDVTTFKGDPNIYTGQVLANRLGYAEHPEGLTLHLVTFFDGACTNWHVHPAGQILHVTTGVGQFQREGDEIVTLLPGDTVTIEPNVRHWHGAAKGQLFAHLAINGDKAPQWFEKVDRS
ncbi:cupin domain-containing protein [Mesorhizobium sp. M0088]|uniref:cupin domain-containing protein n=1 Tax=Mesorhizobium sp. M0088 TaxID=2956873 RepID=UPI003339DE72